MSIKKLITVPNETLRKTSDPVEDIGQNEKNLLMIYLKPCITIKVLVWQQYK